MPLIVPDVGLRACIDFQYGFCKIATKIVYWPIFALYFHSGSICYFEIIAVLNFHRFGLKCLFTPFLKYDSLSGEQYQQNHSKHSIYLRTTTVLTLLAVPVSRDICRYHIAIVNDLVLFCFNLKLWFHIKIILKNFKNVLVFYFNMKPRLKWNKIVLAAKTF